MQVCKNVSAKISDANFCDQKCLSILLWRADPNKQYTKKKYTNQQ